MCRTEGPFGRVSPSHQLVPTLYQTNVTYTVTCGIYVGIFSDNIGTKPSFLCNRKLRAGTIPPSRGATGGDPPTAPGSGRPFATTRGHSMPWLAPDVRYDPALHLDGATPFHWVLWDGPCGPSLPSLGAARAATTPEGGVVGVMGGHGGPHPSALRAATFPKGEGFWGSARVAAASWPPFWRRRRRRYGWAGGATPPLRGLWARG